jgi:hypothetical protein
MRPGEQGLQGEDIKPQVVSCTPTVLMGQGAMRRHLLPVPRTIPSPAEMSARKAIINNPTVAAAGN